MGALLNEGDQDMDLSSVEFYPESHIAVKSVDELKDNVEIFSGFEERSVAGSTISLNDDGFLTGYDEGQQYQRWPLHLQRACQQATR